MKKYLFFGLSLITLFQSIIPSGAYDVTNKNQGTVKESPKVDTSIPTRFKSMETDNLNKRLDILPDHLQKYRNADQFMVIPAMGLVTPIVELETTNPDYKLATKGGDFDYNKYLVSGPTIYPGTAPVGNPGNTFIFAHSNYRINKPGDFKTIFRLTYNIEQGDIIRYYKKENNNRKQYTFTVTKSMLVNETDIRVMLPTKGKKEITLSACRPIGTAKQRWINKAELTSEKTIEYTIESTKKSTKDNNNNQNFISGNSNGGNNIIQSGNLAIEYKPKAIDSIVNIAYELAISAAKLIIK